MAGSLRACARRAAQAHPPGIAPLFAAPRGLLPRALLATLAGGEDGQVRVFDLREGSEAARFPAAADTVCAVSFHPVLPLLTTASGQRRYPLAPHDDSDSDSSSSGLESNSELAASSGNDSGGEGAARQSSLAADENVLRVWCFAAQPLQAADAAAEVADCDQHQAAAGEEADAAEPMAADA